MLILEAIKMNQKRIISLSLLILSTVFAIYCILILKETILAQFFLLGAFSITMILDTRAESFSKIEKIIFFVFGCAFYLSAVDYLFLKFVNPYLFLAITALFVLFVAFCLIKLIFKNFKK